jgi:uncharacterized membrane protein YdbT with pleckstrin-like domain
MIRGVALSKDLLNEGEEFVISTRTHIKALLLPLLSLCALLAIGVVSQTKIDEVIVTRIVWGVVLVGVVWFVLRPFLTWLTASYTITTRRIITRRGVVTRRGYEIPLSRVSGVSYEKDLIDRLLGCGTLVVSDASTNGQVPLADIPQVEETQRILSNMLHELHQGKSRDDGV